MTTSLVEGLRLCCVELWHLVGGVDNKVPQLPATQSEPLDNDLSRGIGKATEILKMYVNEWWLLPTM